MHKILSIIASILRTRAFYIALIVFVGLLCLYLFGYRWRPAVQAQFKQRALVSAMENNSSKKWSKLISDDYLDAWDLSKEDAQKGFKELRKQFLFLSVKQDSDIEIVVDGDTVSLSVYLEIAGRGSPVGEGIKTLVNDLDAPFVFVWRKEGGAPWKWRLIEVRNEALPTLRGYKPGDFS